MHLFKPILKLIILVLILVSCRKNEVANVSESSSKLIVNIKYNANEFTLQKDTILYKNASGNKYSISRLQYYISGIKLYLKDSSFYESNQVFYLDGFEDKSNTILIEGIKPNEYTSIDFNIGINSNFNEHGKISNTNENINMYWPDEMGGGYHFLKFEGNYLNSDNKTKGFALHLGTNPLLIKHQKINQVIQLNKNISDTIELNMNINKWFDGETTYNFLVDGNYSMGIISLMQKLQSNGKAVFENRN